MRRLHARTWSAAHRTILCGRDGSFPLPAFGERIKVGANQPNGALCPNMKCQHLTIRRLCSERALSHRGRRAFDFKNTVTDMNVALGEGDFDPGFTEFLLYGKV